MFEAWGETGRRNGGNFHPLAHRCMDAAAVFARTMEPPVVRDRLETAAGAPLADPARWRRAVLVFLRGIGKPPVPAWAREPPARRAAALP